MKKTLLLFTLLVALISILSAQPPEFNFTPNNASAGVIAAVEVDREPASDYDWIAAFDEDNNCAGAVRLLSYGGQTFCNLQIYGDDFTTPNIDEGINDGETFTFKLWVAATNEILENPVGILPVEGWSSGLQGYAISGWDFANRVVLNFISEPTDGDADGDGFFVGINDPDDTDPCNPDNSVLACDSDGDGISGMNDPDDNDPCNPNINAFACDTDGDGISGMNDPDDNDPCNPNINAFACDTDDDGISGMNDPDDNDPCNPNINAFACDTDDDGVPATNDPDDNDPCNPDNNVAACDTDNDGIPNGADTSTPPSEFNFTPNNISAGVIATVELNGEPASGNDWIAAFDEDNNCAGAVRLLSYGGQTFCNLQVYSDDFTTPNIDDGINAGETFTFKLWVAATNQVLDHPMDIEPVSGWSALDGQAISGYDFFDNAVLNFIGNVDEIDIGCTDIVACNYKPNATIDDNSCFYPEPNFQCGDCNAGGIDEGLLTNGLTVCQNSVISLCTNGLEDLTQACNAGEYDYYWRVYVKSGNLFTSWIEVSGWVKLGPCSTIPVADLFIDKEGQLPPLYTPGSVIVPQADEPLSLLIEAAAICINENGDIIDGCLAENGPDFLSFINSSTRRTVIEVTYYLTGNKNCVGKTIGCTDANACNFDSFAIEDDGSCVGIGDACNDKDATTIEDTYNENCECTGNLIGCTDANACNYNPDATIEDDGSCVGIGDACNDEDATTIEDTYNESCECIGFVPFSRPAEFDFIPNNSSMGVIATVEINGIPASGYDWIAAFDEDNNCAGAVQLLDYGGQAFCNLQVYGNDFSTPDIDEGIDSGETFTFRLWVAATGEILENPVGILPVSGWHGGLGGSTVPGYGFTDGVVLNFTRDIDEINIGCTNTSACNYNPDATIDEGLCIYPEIGYDCDGNCLIDCAGVCGGTTFAGSPCNDGDPNTVNDVYQNNCFCAGHNPIEAPAFLNNNILNLNITDPCNCIFGIDLDGDNVNDLSREIFTITGNRPPFTISNSNGNFYDSTGNSLDNAALASLIIGSTLQVWVNADNNSIHYITITDNTDRDITVSGGPCASCPEINEADCTPPSAGSFNCE